jgi:hypothetical protein
MTFWLWLLLGGVGYFALSVVVAVAIGMILGRTSSGGDQLPSAELAEEAASDPLMRERAAEPARRKAGANRAKAI